MKTALSQRAFVGASVYLILALVWITFSDQLLALLIRDAGLLTLGQILKGWFFVCATAGLLYVTLRKAEQPAALPAPAAPFRASLRSRVVGLVVLTTLPLVALTIYNSLEEQRAERAAAGEQVRRFTRLTVLRHERIIHSIQEMLFTLAKLPGVQRADVAECERLFADLLPLSGRHMFIGAARPNGTVFASAPPNTLTGNLAERPWFEQAIHSHEMVIDNDICAQPVYDDSQRLRAVVFAGVDSQWIDRFAGELRLPENAVVTLVNQHGRITARTADAAQWVDRVWPVALDATGPSDATFEVTDVDGVKRIQAILPMSSQAGTGWVIVGLPATLVTLDSNRTLLRNLMIIAVAALAAIAAAFGMAELSIFRHLRELTAATRRLSAGHLTVRTQLPDAPNELRELAHAFDEMAGSLEQRTRERDHVEQMLRAAEAKLKAAIESLPFDFWLADLESRFVMQNAASIRRWGNLLGKRPGETGLPADTCRTWQFNQRRALTGEIITREVREERAGEVRHYQNIIAPIRIDEQAVGVLGVSVDVTAHRRAEETLRALTRRLRAVREEESTRIAREVHDELGQAMTALKFDLAWCGQQAPPPAVQEKLAAMTRAVDATIQTVRRIAAELRPGVLDNLGLVAAIEWQAQEFQRRTGIRCQLNLPEAHFNLAGPRATAIFRIFQEALTNIARHAKATEAGVTLVRANGQLILEVEDNGIGLKTDPWQDPHSLGLFGMRERARSLNGELTVQPGAVHGTVVTVSLPITETAIHGEFAL